MDKLTEDAAKLMSAEQMKQMCSGMKQQMPPSADTLLKDNCPKMQEKIQLLRKLCDNMKPGDDGDKKPDMPDGASLCATLQVMSEKWMPGLCASEGMVGRCLHEVDGQTSRW